MIRSLGEVKSCCSVRKQKSSARPVSSLASIVAFYALGGSGRPHILHEDKKVDAWLKERVKSLVSVKKGVFYTDVSEGTVLPGTRLRFQNEAVSIEVEITETGTVLLKPGAANVVDFNKAMDDGWSRMLELLSDNWRKSALEFEDPIQIIKIALDKQRLHNQERYKFEVVTD